MNDQLDIISDQQNAPIKDRVHIILGWAGIIPFVVAVGHAFQSEMLFGFNPVFVFVSYSVVILSFMSGALWGMSVNLECNATRTGLLVLSNLACLSGWAALLSAPVSLLYPLFLLPLGYLSVLLTEIRYLKTNVLQAPALQPSQAASHYGGDHTAFRPGGCLKSAQRHTGNIRVEENHHDHNHKADSGEPGLLHPGGYRGLFPFPVTAVYQDDFQYRPNTQPTEQHQRPLSPFEIR